MQAIAGVYVFTESLPLDLFCDLVQLGFRLEPVLFNWRFTGETDPN